MLAWSLNHKLRVLAGTLGLFALSLVASRFLGSSFMAPSDAGSFSIDFEVAPGLPLDYVDACVADVEKFLGTLPYVETYFSFVGRGTSNQAEINVELKALKGRSLSTREALQNVRRYMQDRFPAALAFRLSERNTSFGFFGGFGGGGVSLSIRGRDLKTLASLMNQFADVLSKTPGISDVNTSLKAGAPELVIELDSFKAEKLGVTETWLANSLRDLVQGTTVAQPLSAGGKDYFIVVRLAAEARDEETDVRNFLVTTPSGKKVPLASLARFSVTASPREIRREAKSRVVRISGNLEPGYSYSDAVERARRNIEQSIIRPAGYGYDFTGQQRQLEDLVGQIAFAIGLALLFMYMILASLYNSFIQPLVIMISIPLALGLNEGSSGRQALPLAVIGGMLTSTLLTLVVIPVVYEAVEGLMAKMKKRKITTK